MRAGVTDSLDRGWDLLEDGRPDDAAESARKALRRAAHNVEAHVLLGAALLDLGEAEQALEAFEVALRIDPDDPDALLYAADTLVSSLDDPESALDYCARAHAAAPDNPRRMDAELLRIEALAILERLDEAERAVRDLPEALPEGFELRAAQAAFAAGLGERAGRWAKAAEALDADNPDVHHLHGLLAEERGDHPAMARHFLRARELDLREPAPPWGMRAEEFERVAERTLADLPDDVRRHLRDVPILVSDVPSVELVAEGSDPRMMGYFSGVPYPEKSHVGGPAPHLDCIFLYQRNIERYSRSREELVDEIRTTLLHETGHFFALDEDDLEAIGLG
jgi:predicted Zn-dependent protease with MMP-like domain